MSKCNNIPTDCKNYPEECYRCNGSFYYAPQKQQAKKWKQSKRAGSNLEMQSLVANSGAGAFQKGDVKKGEMLIECKKTYGKSIRIKGDDLTKIKEQALEADLFPVLNFQLESEDSPIYSIILYEDLLKLCQ